ncbi:MAG: hypothetical protein JNK38_09140 [Acidobacteria bacterium]|nr:hypothetical protein [Acidobacteriota bacterium]
MKSITTLLLVCCGTLIAFGQQLTLQGTLTTDAQSPVPATRISVHGITNTTDQKGQYKLVLGGSFREGERVIIAVEKIGWVINSPLDGEWNLPNIRLQNVQTLKIILVPKGSKSLWSHARIEKHIAKLSDEIARLKEDDDQPRPVDFSFYLREWAEQYGFTPEQVKAAFDEWAKAVEKSDDYRALGLRAFYQKNFPLAAENFVKAAQKDEGQIKSVQEQLDRNILDAYKNRKDAGSSFKNSYQYKEALEQYAFAKLHLAGLTSKDKYWYEQAQIELMIGNATRDMGKGIDGEEGTRLLAKAMDSYQRAFVGFTRQRSLRNWALTQRNFGDALKSLGARMEDNQSAKLFAEAIAAYHNALHVYIRERFPEDWALTHGRLGDALRSQSAIIEDAQSAKLLGEAVAAYQSALLVYTRDRSQNDWAFTQNLLGQALKSLSEKTEGSPSVNLLVEAVTAHRNALQVYTREYLPVAWALTQNDLGNALEAQSAAVEDAQSRKLLAEAVAAHRLALQVETRERSPKSWAIIQRGLGSALLAQGQTIAGEEGANLLAEAVVAYCNALQVRTREQSPRQWAAAQNSLGNALLAQGQRGASAERLRLLAEAVAAYHNALQVRTREQWPRQWAETQDKLCIAFWSQGTRIAGTEGAKLLAEAATACRNALEVRTREQSPQNWAETQSHLGIALSSQGVRIAGSEGVRLLVEAAAAYRNALLVITRDKLPQRWAETQHNLGSALWRQAIFMKGNDRERLFAEAVIAYRNALLVRTPDHLPEKWAETQYGLGETYYFSARWSDAAECFASLLARRQTNEIATFSYSRLSDIYHERLFEYELAFKLHQKRLADFPDNLNALVNFAETHFTTGRFAECERRIAALLANHQIAASTSLALRMIDIANSLAMNQADQVPPKLEAIIRAITDQPENFKFTWTFNGTLHFMGENEKLAAYRDWLKLLFSAAEGKNRDAVLKVLREAKAGFKW